MANIKKQIESLIELPSQRARTRKSKVESGIAYGRNIAGKKSDKNSESMLRMSLMDSKSPSFKSGLVAGYDKGQRIKYNNPKIPQYKKGGVVKKTGLALVHKGERVLNAKQTKKFDKRKVAKAARKVYGQ